MNVGKYRVTMRARAFGLLFEEQRTVTASDEQMAKFSAWGQVENDLILAGAATHDCGCCLLPGRVEGGDVFGPSGYDDDEVYFAVEEV